MITTYKSISQKSNLEKNLNEKAKTQNDKNSSFLELQTL